MSLPSPRCLFNKLSASCALASSTILSIVALSFALLICSAKLLNSSSVRWLSSWIVSVPSPRCRFNKLSASCCLASSTMPSIVALSFALLIWSAKLLNSSSVKWSSSWIASVLSPRCRFNKLSASCCLASSTMPSIVALSFAFLIWFAYLLNSSSVRWSKASIVSVPSPRWRFNKFVASCCLASSTILSIVSLSFALLIWSAKLLNSSSVRWSSSWIVSVPSPRWRFNKLSASCAFASSTMPSIVSLSFALLIWFAYLSNSSSVRWSSSWIASVLSPRCLFNRFVASCCFALSTISSISALSVALLIWSAKLLNSSSVKWSSSWIASVLSPRWRFNKFVASCCLACSTMLSIVSLSFALLIWPAKWLNSSSVKWSSAWIVSVLSPRCLFNKFVASVSCADLTICATASGVLAVFNCSLISLISSSVRWSSALTVSWPSCLAWAKSLFSTFLAFESDTAWSISSFFVSPLIRWLNSSCSSLDKSSKPLTSFVPFAFCWSSKFAASCCWAFSTMSSIVAWSVAFVICCSNFAASSSFKCVNAWTVSVPSPFWRFKRFVASVSCALFTISATASGVWALLICSKISVLSSSVKCCNGFTVAWPSCLAWARSLFAIAFAFASATAPSISSFVAASLIRWLNASCSSSVKSSRRLISFVPSAFWLLSRFVASCVLACSTISSIVALSFALLIWSW